MEVRKHDGQNLGIPEDYIYTGGLFSRQQRSTYKKTRRTAIVYAIIMLLMSILSIWLGHAENTSATPAEGIMMSLFFAILALVVYILTTAQARKDKQAAERLEKYLDQTNKTKNG